MFHTPPVRRALFVVLPVFLGCPMMGVETIEITVSPRQVRDDGSIAQVRVLATDAQGNVGKGSVKVKSSAGSLASGETVMLDSFGGAMLEFSCNVAIDLDCRGTVTLTAEWARPQGPAVTGETTVRLVAPPAPMDAGSTGATDVLMVGTTNGSLEMGLGPISGTPSASIRTGISLVIGVNASGSANRRMLLTSTGDLIYVTYTGPGPNGLCIAGQPCTFGGYRIFRSSGVDEAISTPGCMSGDDRVSFFESPSEGVIYACPQGSNATVINKLTDGMPSEWMSNRAISGASVNIEALGQGGMLITGAKLFATPATTMPVDVQPSACDVAVATGRTFLCLATNRLVRISGMSSTTIGTYDLRTDFNGYTSGTTLLNGVLGADGRLYRGMTSGGDSTSPSIVVVYPPPQGNTVSTGTILVDSRASTPPMGMLRSFNLRMRPVGRSFY